MLILAMIWKYAFLLEIYSEFLNYITIIMDITLCNVSYYIEITMINNSQSLLVYSVKFLYCQEKSKSNLKIFI